MSELPVRLGESGPWVSALATSKSTKIYAAVVDQDGLQRSQLWRFATHRDDVYGGGPAMGLQKLSLHASRICRWAHNKPLADGTDRAFIKWVRQPADQSLRCVFSIIFPGEHLSAPKALERDTPFLIRLPVPPPGGATQLGVFYSLWAPHEFRLPDDVVSHYTGMSTPSGEWVYLIAKTIENYRTDLLPEPWHEMPEDARKAILDQHESHALYVHLFSEADESGAASVVELNGITLTR